MFTTLTPGAQALSIASRAAMPPKEAPYPPRSDAHHRHSDQTGHHAGSAPSIPATTTMARARRSSSTGPAPVQAGHPDVDHQLGGPSEVAGGQVGLPRDREVRGAGGEHRDQPPREQGVGRPGQQPGVHVMVRVGQLTQYGIGLLGGGPGERVVTSGWRPTSVAMSSSWAVVFSAQYTASG